MLVSDWSGSYTVWPLTSLLGVADEYTHRSEEPVSKSSIRVWAGVPICTGVRYSTSYSCGVVIAEPLDRLYLARPMPARSARWPRSARSSLRMRETAFETSSGIMMLNLR